MQTQTLNLVVEGCRWRFPPLDSVISDADHVDIKTAESSLSLREFVAGMMNYQPGWMSFLYRVRWLFVRLLGMKQEGIPHVPHLTPEDIPMTPGKMLAFFEVKLAEEDRYICMSATEKHLTAALAVVCEPIDAGHNRFYVLTVVHYHHWTGIIYFNVIRPFHHVVVNHMIQAGLKVN